MDINQLVESFYLRFKAFGMRAPQRTAEELLAHVCFCQGIKLRGSQTAHTLSAQQTLSMIHQLEKLAMRLEQDQSPQEVLGCLDY